MNQNVRKSMALLSREEQAVVWDYFKPRYTHAWNMLALSWSQLDQLDNNTELGFETEYHWENFILRLWLYRTTVKILIRLQAVEGYAKSAINEFDNVFSLNGRNQLKALRDMIEHFDDYAAGAGKGAATREGDLDPWRMFDRNRYERGQYCLEREKSYAAAIKLRSEAKRASSAFIRWYKSRD
jgi:hypothetical protein